MNLTSVSGGMRRRAVRSVEMGKTERRKVKEKNSNVCICWLN